MSFELCGMKRRLKMRSEDDRRQLRSVNIVEEIEENQKRWKKHVIRM
jgi:hypothetical protein